MKAIDPARDFHRLQTGLALVQEITVAAQRRNLTSLPSIDMLIVDLKEFNFNVSQ